MEHQQKLGMINLQNALYASTRTDVVVIPLVVGSDR